MSNREFLVRQLSKEEIETAKANGVGICLENPRCARPVSYAAAQRNDRHSKSLEWMCVRLSCAEDIRNDPDVRASAAPPALQPLSPSTPPIGPTAWNQRYSSHFHEGHVACRMPDGLLTGGRGDDTTGACAYVSACHCGWTATNENPSTSAGLDAAEQQWRVEHLQPLFQHVIELGAVVGHFHGTQ